MRVFLIKHRPAVGCKYQPRRRTICCRQYSGAVGANIGTQDSDGIFMNVSAQPAKVVVFSLGGTIASIRSATGKALAGALSGEDLFRQLKIDTVADVELQTLLQKPSNAITTDDLLSLRQHCITAAYRADVAGIVVSQGTDTLEDTAYFLDATLDLAGTGLVVTGAQRVPYAAGSDAGPNLRDAITTARSTAARGQGALVVFNEEIHAGDVVRKISSFQVNGFGSPGYGPLGFVDGGDIYMRHRAGRAVTIAPGKVLPRVDILPVTLGAHPALIEASVNSGARGLVLDAIGRGHVPPDWMDGLDRVARRGIPIVVTSVTLSGRLAEAYEYRGSLADLVEIGAVAVHHLSARKARLRMMSALSADIDIDSASMNFR